MSLLIRILGPLGGAAVLVAALGAIVRYLANKYLDAEFDRRIAAHKHELDRQLETHKNQLGIEAEAVRADNQRRIQDFSLYTSRRHRVYAKLFALVREAEGHLNTASNGAYSFDVATLTREIVECELDGPDILPGAKERTLQAWDEDVERGIRAFTAALEARDEQSAFLAFGRVRNYFWTNELYLSDEVREQARKTLVTLQQWRSSPHASTTMKERADAAIAELRVMMQSELRAGDYQQRHPTPSPDTRSPTSKP